MSRKIRREVFGESVGADLFEDKSGIDPDKALALAMGSMGENIQHPEVLSRVNKNEIFMFACLKAVNTQLGSTMIDTWVDWMLKLKISEKGLSRKELEKIACAMATASGDKRQGLFSRIGGIFGR